MWHYELFQAFAEAIKCNFFLNNKEREREREF